MSNKISFEEYLENELNKPCDNPLFDEDGNSSRAVMLRFRKSKWTHLKWCFKTVFKDLRNNLVYHYRGLETPLIWFIQVLTIPFLFPFIPFLNSYFVYKRAIKQYRECYEVYKGTK